MTFKETDTYIKSLEPFANKLGFTMKKDEFFINVYFNKGEKNIAFNSRSMTFVYHDKTYIRKSDQTSVENILIMESHI